MKARWQSEKDAIGKIRKLKERIEQLKAITRRYFFQRSAAGIGGVALAALANERLFAAVVDESQAAGFVEGLEAIGVLRTKLELPEKIASSIDVTGYEGCGRAAGSCAVSRIVMAAVDLHFGGRRVGLNVQGHGRVT